MTPEALWQKFQRATKPASGENIDVPVVFEKRMNILFIF